MQHSVINVSPLTVHCAAGYQSIEKAGIILPLETRLASMVIADWKPDQVLWNKWLVLCAWCSLYSRLCYRTARDYNLIARIFTPHALSCTVGLKPIYDTLESVAVNQCTTFNIRSLAVRTKLLQYSLLYANHSTFSLRTVNNTNPLVPGKLKKKC